MAIFDMYLTQICQDTYGIFIWPDEILVYTIMEEDAKHLFCIEQLYVKKVLCMRSTHHIC
jgi:hypothetical protein